MNFQLSVTFTGKNSAVVLGIFVDSTLADAVADQACNLLGDDVRPVTVNVLSDTITNGSAEITLSCDGADAGIFEIALEEIFDAFDDHIRAEIFALESRGVGRFEIDLESYTVNTFTPHPL